MLRVLIAAGLTVALGGCEVMNAVMQRAALAKADFSLERVALLAADLPFTPNAKADMQVVLGIANPNDIAVLLDKLDYELFLQGVRVGTGATGGDFSVDPGAKKELALTVAVPYAGLPQAVLTAITQRKADVAFKGISHLKTPLLTLDYPVEVTKTLSF